VPRLAAHWWTRIAVLRPLHDHQVSDSMSEMALRFGDGAA
jgi:hypothetical protein